MKPIPYGRQQITDEDIQAVVETLKSDFLTQGPQVDAFEKEFAQFIGVDHAIAVSNATAALHLAALALGVKPGDRVLATPITFVASTNCIRYCGGDVEFVDIDAQTFCMDLDKLEDKLKKSKPGTYRGVVVVDFAGYPVDAERLRQIAQAHKLWVIQDSCHAVGGKFQTADKQWHSVGSGEFGDLSIFSFHPVKHLATGEGGMITTRNSALAEKLRELRSHGITRNKNKFRRKSDGGWYYEMQDLGFNYRIPDICCALGRSQLKRLKDNVARRQQIADHYDRELKDLSLTLPYRPDRIRHAFHLYIVQTEKRTELYEFLRTKNIFCQIHYIPVYRQPYYVDLYGEQSLPVADNYYAHCLSLPMYHALSVTEQDYIIQQIKAFYAK